MSSRPIRKIGIFSPSGTLNLGDETTVAVFLEEIKRRYPSAEIYALTANPADTTLRHGIPAYPARNIPAKKTPASPVSQLNRMDAEPKPGASLREKVIGALKRIPLVYRVLKAPQRIYALVRETASELRFIASSFKRIKGTDLLVAAGSGQLCDNFYGVWGFPYNLLKWCLMAKACGTRIMFVSCGAGPIDYRLSKVFLRWSLRMADYRSYRDQGSKELIQKIGIRADDPVVPDLVFGARLDNKGKSRPKLIAVNPFPYYDERYWPVSSHEVYASYTTRLAALVSWLIKKGYTVLLFSTQLRADPLVIEDVKKIVTKDGTLDLEKSLFVKSIADLDDLIDQISMADMVVASRFHGVLISFLLDKPVLALSHHPKVDNLMRDMGQADYLMGIETFDVETAGERLMDLEARQAVVKQQVRSNLAVFQRKLELQYSQLFGDSAELTSGAQSVPSVTAI